jgi:NAD(P)-dependent dehydrogenase (short-subunit alcohol dehydrogenase family)
MVMVGIGKSTQSLRYGYEGKTVIVTGASTGIGLDITERLVEEGAIVIANGRRPDALLDRPEPNLHVVPGDVSDPATASRLVEEAMRVSGRIDTLFNNAGKGLFKAAEETSDDEWLELININLNGAWYVASAVGKIMIAQGDGGAILNVGSGAGIAGITHGVAYVASKHGLTGLTRALATDWGRYGIRVNALAPGFTLTPMTEVFRDENPEAYAERASRCPLGRSGEVREQTAMALFLNSDHASYTSGLIAVVDGGTHAMSAGYKPPAPKA